MEVFPVDISGLDRAEVLATLFNAARPQGMGFARYSPEPMSVEEARELLKRTNRFDYLKGRVMKVDIFEDNHEVDTTWYNRDNGEGAAEMAIISLRSGAGTENQTTERIHEYGRTNAAHELMEELEQNSQRDTANSAL